MNSNNSDDLNKLFWELIEDESIDDTDEELLMTMLERKQQSKSSTDPNEEEKLLIEAVKKVIVDCSGTTSLKIQCTQMPNSDEGFECVGMYFFELLLP
ncbi:hypothetical protein QL285_051446 [Trifolium repens]|jgi:hypothetical protein|nr:hypothetical protein QL285_051446 [Trifolium repens]